MRSLVRHSFLLKELVRRDFQGRYAGSVFGALWSFANPLWLLLLYTFVFSTVMKISLVGERSENFGIWMFCGILPWMAIAESMTRGVTTITDNANLVKKLGFPSRVLVVSVVLSSLLHEAVAAIVFVVVLAILGEADFVSLGWLLPAVILQFGMTLGIVSLVASVQVFFRDVAQVLGMLMNAWFFLTPIVYPLYLAEEAHPTLAAALLYNPLTSLVELYRCAFLGGGMTAELAWGVARLSVVAAVLAGVGMVVIRRLESSFSDVL